MNTPAFEQSNPVLNAIIHSILLNEHQRNPIQALINTEQLTQVIYQHPEDRLFIVTHDGNGLPHVAQTALAKAVILTLAHCLAPMTSYFPVYTANPYIDVFVRNAGNGGLIEKVFRHEALNRPDGVYPNDLEYAIFRDLAAGLVEFLNAIRQELQSSGFRTRVYNAQRLSNKNAKGLLNYIDSLFAQYARLLVLRVDLGYQSSNVIRTEPDKQRKYLEAKHDRQRFLDNMGSNRLFEHLVGYAWKLEYGPDKGFHYHMLFFYDGSKVREDETLAMLIGEYWKNAITQGRGLYYNCNAFKQNYANLGIGMINYYDLALREGLNEAACYLTKTDHVARMLVADNGRTFGRGEIAQPSDNKSGRPRSFASEAGI
jgi:hypothetical protein